MTVEITCSAPFGEIEVIPSKSAAHRLLICASLADKPTEIVCPASSLDIAATARCLSSLGAVVKEDGGVYTVVPIRKREEASLLCGESGSTLRFLIPVAAALGGDVTFSGEGRLPERPVSQLTDCLISRGASIDYSGTLPLTTHGGLRSGRFAIAGNVSSQFISGLIFALPLLSGDSEIDITGKIESLSYIKMTLDAVHTFGIKAEMSGNKIKIPGNQQYRSPGRLTVEGDWSNAAFWLCLGALSKDGITM
ncbi:MAG: 3-phosphoshikimate 1-carboxyvinyltransferase, partial [Oscillospiraceae bacterium]|nr:3-phosphoshikimate 1-carboxyvinyltransferase [Oscillospiraceae bacterium]